jgi:hypothetical protein
MGSLRSPVVLPYDRSKAVEYAHKWAYKRNPAYVDFEHMGGDCTNFASQVIYAGVGVMNYTPTFGWYYINIYNRAPAWTGVNNIYDFLISNKGVGPFAELVDMKDADIGDIVQLSFGGGNHYNHSPVIVDIKSPVTYDNILVAAHTDDQDNYRLTGYEWVDIRFIHVLGVRKY